MLDGLLGALLGVSLASAPPASPAGDAFLFSLDNGKTNAFYRVQSVDGNLREVRYRESYAKPKVWHDTPSISSAVYTSRIDCSAKTMQTLMAEAYRDPDALTGPVVSKPLSLAPDPINLAKDSVGARIVKAACAVTRPDRQEKTEAARSADNPSSINEGFGTTQPGTPPSTDSGAALATPGQGGQGVASVPGVGPVTFGEFAAQHPFADSKITLGVLGLLSEYVYFTEEELAFKSAVLSKFRRGYNATLPERGPMRVTLTTALERLTAELDAYQAKINEKRALLVGHGLTPLPLPGTEHEPWDSFRAELYREEASGELVLVFRGTAGAKDWVSNIWLGADLFKIEAPHYAAARELVGAVIRTGRRPIVTGHSLGGGLAQYAAAKFALRAVAFNSSPLPIRYFSSMRKIDPSKIRVYSAIEKKTSAQGEDSFRPDPVSLTVPGAFESVNAALGDEYIKAHFHLVKPTCVESSPDPFMSPSEEKDLTDEVNRALLTGILNGVLSKSITGISVPGTVVDLGLKQYIDSVMSESMRAPDWKPDSRSEADKAIHDRIVDEVQLSAVLTYKEMGGSINALKGMWWLASGRYMDGAKTWGNILGEAGARAAAQTHILMPHSMGRFNRGMLAQMDADPFVAKAVLAQCLAPLGARFDTPR